MASEARVGFHFQMRNITTAIMQLVMNMVPVTAMP
jgi:hypothetical protein